MVRYTDFVVAIYNVTQQNALQTNSTTKLTNEYTFVGLSAATQYRVEVKSRVGQVASDAATSSTLMATRKFSSL